ncbi:hypothetical protein D8M04_09605 [Oceanobacillus piezotolerans]|uniref:Uncharacterized protein n=1 Tax=Oceanobacillus piezotolerans TaxID=2448030 RepID=A0A498DBJ9_9BACI|nr:3D domain-containing protein [Oceanobacillus piezotolerans]RLL45113.1 hypothetical protein D8M04_09605 [Oceanobacillus piezotolerans]
MRKLFMVLMAAVLVLGNLLVVNPTNAEDESELKKIQDDRSDIKANLSEAESEIANLVTDLEQMNKELNQLDTELIKNQETIEKTNKDIDNTIAEVQSLEKEIKELEAKIEERFEILKTRVVSYQQTGGHVQYLEVIFGAESFGDFISRVSAVNKITDADAKLMEQQELDKQQVIDNQNKVLVQLDNLNALKAQQDEAVALLEKQKAVAEEKRIGLESKQGELLARISELETKDSNLASLETKIKADIETEKKKAAELAAKKAEEKAQTVKVTKPAETVVASVNTENKQETKQQEETVKETKTTVKEPAKEVKAEKQEKQEKQQKQEKQENKKSFTVTATAYTVDSAGGSGKTATGIDLIKNPNAKVIAVDPSLIPLGTLVHVEGYGYAVAGDTGGAIRGNKIDVFVPTAQAAINWGVRTVKVTIVD